MRCSLIFLGSLFFSFALWASHEAPLEKQFHTLLDNFNQELKYQLLEGDLSNKEIKKSLDQKISEISLLARKHRGIRHSFFVRKNLQLTTRGLTKFQQKHPEVLNFIYPNGMSGKQILQQALDPQINQEIVRIYENKKNSLFFYQQGEKLNEIALQETLEELSQDEKFQFLFLNSPLLKTSKPPLFNFISDRCSPENGEGDFHILLFGFYRCHGNKFRVDRYTIGPGYYNASTGTTHIQGLRIGRKSFFGVGANVKIGVYYGAGLGVFVGNGLMLTLDLERTYGVFAGATYLNVRPKTITP